ncbi:MAG TPA: hypothetical protein VJB02_00225 [Coxiellaceae bacterium]|nr:hypothetical protein [Coxiellaceae bacterium]
MTLTEKATLGNVVIAVLLAAGVGLLTAFFPPAGILAVIALKAIGIQLASFWIPFVATGLVLGALAVLGAIATLVTALVQFKRERDVAVSARQPAVDEAVAAALAEEREAALAAQQEAVVQAAAVARGIAEQERDAAIAVRQLAVEAAVAAQGIAEQQRDVAIAARQPAVDEAVAAERVRLELVANARTEIAVARARETGMVAGAMRAGTVDAGAQKAQLQAAVERLITPLQEENRGLKEANAILEAGRAAAARAAAASQTAVAAATGARLTAAREASIGLTPGCSVAPPRAAYVEPRHAGAARGALVLSAAASGSSPAALEGTAGAGGLTAR